jgi:hypothetical protein
MNSKIWSTFSLLFIIVVFGTLATSVPGFATSSTTTVRANDAQLTALNCAIIHKEIELEKSNARFLMNSHPEGRWKAWRYFFFQETGGALIEAGLVTGLADRYRQMDHGGKIRGVLLEDSLVPQMIGQFVAATGDVLELGLNVRLAYRTKREHRDAGTSKRAASNLHRELLSLLEQREFLLSNAPELCTSISKLETRILRDEEHLVWLQYSRSLLDSRKLAVTENTFYSLDILKNLTGAAGNIVSMAAISARRPKLNVGANALTSVSGGLIMSNPVTSRLAGKLVSRIHSKGLDSKFRQKLDDVVASLTENSDALKEAYKNLDSQNGPYDRVLSTRVNLYSKQAARAGSFVETQKARDRRANTGALNTMAVAAFAGATKVAAGTCGIIAADKLSDHAGASVLLGGTAAYTAGVGATLCDNLKINVIRERRFDLQKRNATSSQNVLARELKDLDVLDNQLRITECAQPVD